MHAKLLFARSNLIFALEALYNQGGYVFFYLGSKRWMRKVGTKLSHFQAYNPRVFCGLPALIHTHTHTHSLNPPSQF